MSDLRIHNPDWTKFSHFRCLYFLTPDLWGEDCGTWLFTPLARDGDTFTKWLCLSCPVGFRGTTRTQPGEVIMWLMRVDDPKLDWDPELNQERESQCQ